MLRIDITKYSTVFCLQWTSILLAMTGVTGLFIKTVISMLGPGLVFKKCLGYMNLYHLNNSIVRTNVLNLVLSNNGELKVLQSVKDWTK